MQELTQTDKEKVSPFRGVTKSKFLLLDTVSEGDRCALSFKSKYHFRRGSVCRN